MNLSAVIEALVYEKQGCKGVELFGEIVQYYYKSGYPIPTFDQIIEELEKMVKYAQLIEIEYDIPQMRYRAKSFYLPANSTVVVKGSRA